MSIQACHPGCEVQIGVELPTCLALVETIEHEDSWGVGDHGQPELILAWTEERRCHLVNGHLGSHDPDAIYPAVLWRDPAGLTLEPNRVYRFRARHREVGPPAWATLWGESGPVLVSEPPRVAS